MTIAYKLLKVRKDGTLGPLFINRRQRIPIGVWLDAEDHPTKGYAHRPGWHTTSMPSAPHLSMKGRAWYEVYISDYSLLKRPLYQGGLWYISKKMQVVGPVV